MRMASVYLDHIVILLPHKDVVDLPNWLTDYFTITPGGVHAGGQTENKLIIFRDGSYIELIAFVNDDPTHRTGHRWGDKGFGIIDLALSSQEDADESYALLKGRLAKAEVGVKYEQPEAGGRTRDDGQILKWKVTVPAKPTLTGEAPFFCHDITSRDLRVPFSEESTSHPSGAFGVKGLKIYVLQERVGDLSKAYSAILDVKNGSVDSKVGRFAVKSLRSVEGKSGAVLNIQEPSDDKRKRLVAGRGALLCDLEFGKINSTEESSQTLGINLEYDVGRIIL
jgi:hypothetical protein